MYNVFDTEQEAIDAQEADFQSWKATKPQMPENYWAITTSWGKVQQRVTDSKWVYPVCPDGSKDHTQEELQTDWFPTE